MPPASASLRDQIENAIIAGDYTPGERLDEVKLATRFGVSRTPIREALMQLSASGLVEIRPRRGAVVSKVAPERLVEMFEVMAELEAMSVQLAARRYTDADMARIVEAHETCRRATEVGDIEAYYNANERFHHALYAASHHGFLIEQCAQLYRRLKPYRRLQLRVRHRMAASFAEHDSVVKALQSYNGELAAKLLRAHIVVQGERFSDLVASLNQAASERAAEAASVAD